MEDGSHNARRPDGLIPVAGNIAHEALPVDYDELPVQTALELEELVRLRAQLRYDDWKSHPRFKKDRVIREAQRRYGVPANDAPLFPLFLAPANDIDAEADLAGDEDYAALCDARREAWISDLECPCDDTNDFTTTGDDDHE